MRLGLFGLFFITLSVNCNANEMNKKYQYEDFLISSDRGLYLQQQIDSNNYLEKVVGEKKCEKILKFTQISNDGLVLHLQVLCKNFDENLHVFMPKTVDKDLVINKCEEVEKNPNIKTKCQKILIK